MHIIPIHHRISNAFHHGHCKLEMFLLRSQLSIFTMLIHWAYLLSDPDCCWSRRAPCKAAGLHELQVNYNFSVSCNSHGVAVKVEPFEIDETIVYGLGIYIIKERRQMACVFLCISGPKVTPVSNRKAKC